MSAPDLSEFQSDPQAQPVLAQIAAGKWRKARDSARDLWKKDRAKYLPLLLAANTGLAEDLLTRRLDEDAATVIGYLKTVAPPESVAELEAKLARNRHTLLARKGTPEEAAAAAWAIVSAPDADPADKSVRAAADRLVTGAEPPAGTDAPELRAELAAARAAADATARAAWEEARAALRGVTAGSVFGSWRLFLRGVRCVHTGETAMARQCFEALPPGSAAARAAWAYRPVCGLPGGADAPPLAARTAFTAALCGATPQGAAAVAQADALWRAQDVPAAMLALSSGMGRGLFPAETPGLGSALTELFFANDFQRSKLRDEALDKYAEWLERRLKRAGDNKLSPLEERCFRAQLLRLDAGQIEGAKILDHAGRIVALDTALHGPDDLRAAAVWEFAATVFPGPEDETPPWMTEADKDNTEALRRCAALDPAYPPRVVALANELGARRALAEVRELLTRSLKLMPEQPDLLARAGIAEHAAKNPEGLNLLRKAVRLDPAMRDASDALFTILRDQAAKARTFDPALWDELESLSRATPAAAPVSPAVADLRRQRWFVRLERAREDPAPQRPVPPAFATPSPFVETLAAAIFSSAGYAHAPGDGTPPVWRDLCWALLLIHTAAREAGRPVWREAVEKFLIGSAEALLTKKALMTPAGASGSLAFARTVDAILEQEEEDESKDGRRAPMRSSLPLRFVKLVASALHAADVRRGSYHAALASILIPPACAFARPCECGELRKIATDAMAAGDRVAANEAEKQILACGAKTAPPWSRVAQPTAARNNAAPKKSPVKKVPAKKAAAKKATARRPSGAGDSAAAAAPSPPGGLIQDDLFTGLGPPPPPSRQETVPGAERDGAQVLQNLGRSIAAMEELGLDPNFPRLIERFKSIGEPMSMARIRKFRDIGRILNLGATRAELERFAANKFD